MKILETLGATSRIWQIFVADSSSTTGAGLTNLAFNTASLTAYYHRDTDTTATAITLVTMTVGTFTSSGFKEIDATNMPGWYQLCPPNAALASGAKSVALLLKGATNMAPLPIEVQLTAVDFTDAVRGGMTALPNANAAASGGLIINGSNAGTVTLAAMTVTGSLTLSDGLLVSRSTSNASAITATGNGTGSGIVATSGSGATGDGMKAVAASTNGNGFTFTKTGTGLDFNATSTPLILAKTTNITGLNDIPATAIVSGGAITTSGGAVSTVTTTNAIGSGGITDASFAADVTVKAIRANTAQAGASTTITLDASANATNSFYNNTLIKLTGGTGVGQARFITGYVGATKVATVNSAWVTNPDNTTTFDIIAFDQVPGASAPTAAQVATAVWQDATAGDFTVASSIGKSLYTTGNAPGAASGLALVGSNMGTVSSVTGAVGSVTGAVGSVTGSVGSVTGAVGSVTGNVGGNVVGSVASVTARVTANTDQLAGQTVTAAAGVTFPASVASPTNITAGTITTTTNVTNGVTLAANSVDATAIAANGAAEIATAVGALSLGASNNNYTLIQGTTILLSAVAGKVSGEDVGAPAFRDLANTKDVITGTDSGTGNRLTISYNP